MWRHILGWFALGLAATAYAQPRVETISYVTSPCFGRCPVYRVTIATDGTGLFEGVSFTAVQGRRDFRITRAQYDAFAARLAPYRPRGQVEITYGHPRCRTPATDHPSVMVGWTGGRYDRLSFYYGCRDAGNAAMARALQSAPGLLPIGDLIGGRR